VTELEKQPIPSYVDLFRGVKFVSLLLSFTTRLMACCFRALIAQRCDDMNREWPEEAARKQEVQVCHAHCSESSIPTHAFSLPIAHQAVPHSKEFTSQFHSCRSQVPRTIVPKFTLEIPSFGSNVAHAAMDCFTTRTANSYHNTTCIHHARGLTLESRRSLLI